MGTLGLLCRLAVLSTNHVQVGCRASPRAICAVPPNTAVASAAKAANRRNFFRSVIPLVLSSSPWPSPGPMTPDPYWDEASHRSGSTPIDVRLGFIRMSNPALTDHITVPFVDLNRLNEPVRADFLEAVSALVDSGAFVNGPAVGSFERAFASYCRTADAVGVASGLDALRLALLAAGIEPGDEVIVPAQTFVATLEAVTQAGGTPVPAEIGATDYNLDPAAAEAAVTSRTKLLLPVHLYGQMADMVSLRSLADRNGLAII